MCSDLLNNFNNKLDENNEYIIDILLRNDLINYNLLFDNKGRSAMDL